MGGDWSWEKGGAYINIPVVIDLRCLKPKRKSKAKKKPVARRKPRSSRKGE